jgi:prolyl-tRNA synthetase
MGFSCDPELEDSLAREHKVSVRCIPLDTADAVVPCAFTGKPGKRVVFAKAY